MKRFMYGLFAFLMTFAVGLLAAPESATHISDFVTTKPASTEAANLTDDYLRQIKTVLYTDFQNIDAAVLSSAAELNILDGVTATATELNYLDLPAAIGTASASKAVVLDANKDFDFGTGDITVTTANITTIGAGTVTTTPSYDDNSTKLATTAYIDRARMNFENDTSIGTGTSITASISSGAERIEVWLWGVSIDGLSASSDGLELRIGTSSTLKSTGYVSQAAGGSSDNTSTTGIRINPSQISDSDIITGALEIERIGGTYNYSVTGIVLFNNNGTPDVTTIAGYVTLSGTIDYIGLICDSGDNFDTGRWRLSYVN